MSDQPVLDLFPHNHHFCDLHATLRTRNQMIHSLITPMYNDFSKESPKEVLSALKSLEDLFYECHQMVIEMRILLGDQIEEDEQKEISHE